MSEQTYSGAAAAVAALLEACAREGASVTRTKVAKLLYLADLEAVEHNSRPGSGFTWVWHNYGPWAAQLVAVEDALVRDGVADRDEGENFYGSKQVTLRLRTAPQYVIDREFEGIVRQVVETYGRLAASSLRDLTYTTAPMVEAQRGERGVALDLEGKRPIKSVAGALRRMAKHRASRGPVGAVDDDTREGLIAEHHEWARSIRNATAKIS